MGDDNAEMIRVRIDQVIALVAFDLVMDIRLLLQLFQLVHFVVAKQVDMDRFQREDFVAAVQLGDYQNIVHHGGDVMAVRIDDFAEFLFFLRLTPSPVMSSAKPLIALSGVRTSWHIFLIKAFFIRSLSCAFSLAYDYQPVRLLQLLVQRFDLS